MHVASEHLLEFSLATQPMPLVAPGAKTLASGGFPSPAEFPGARNDKVDDISSTLESVQHPHMLNMYAERVTLYPDVTLVASG